MTTYKMPENQRLPYVITTDLTKLLEKQQTNDKAFQHQMVKKEKCKGIDGKGHNKWTKDLNCYDKGKQICYKGIKPIKITYKAGECELCKNGQIQKLEEMEEGIRIPIGLMDCPNCNGTGKLHPKVNDTFDSCNICGLILKAGEKTPIEHGTMSITIYPNKPKPSKTCKGKFIKRKFLSINTKKEEAVVVEK